MIEVQEPVVEVEAGTYSSQDAGGAGFPEPSPGQLTKSFSCADPGCGSCEESYEITKTPFSQKIFTGKTCF